MFKIQGSTIQATDKKELVEGLKKISRKGYYSKLFPNGGCLSTDGRLLSIQCSCKKKHDWKFVSKIPRKNWSCNCGRALIQYIRNLRYKFINR